MITLIWSDFRVNAKELWILFVTEKARYFYVTEFCKGV